MGWVHEGYDIAGVEQPLEFEVVMDGEPVNGGPDWTPTHEYGPEPSDEPIKFDAMDNAAETSASQDSQDNEEDNAAEDDEAGGCGLVPGLLVGLVVLLLVAAAVGFVIARGRR